jgi:hypothetical protein
MTDGKILMPETPCTICGDYVAWPANDDSSHCICTECIYTEHAALRQRVVALEAEVEKLRAALKEAQGLVSAWTAEAERFEDEFAAYRADVEPVLRDSIALHDDYLEAPNVHPRNGGG